MKDRHKVGALLSPHGEGKAFFLVYKLMHPRIRETSDQVHRKYSKYLSSWRLSLDIWLALGIALF